MQLKDFYHLSVPEDGGCFFHSIAAVLHFEKNPVLNHTKDPKKVENIQFKLGKESMAIRTRAVNWLKDNLDYVIKGTGLTIRMEIEDDIKEEQTNAKKENNRSPNYKTIDEYLKFMHKNGSYAGQIEIYAVSEVLQRNLRVFTSKNPKDHNESLQNIGLGYELKKLSYSTLPSSKDIYLYHNFGKKGVTKGRHHFEPLIPRTIIKIQYSEEKKSTGGIRKVQKRSAPRKIQQNSAPRKIQQNSAPRKVQQNSAPRKIQQNSTPRRTQRKEVRKTQNSTPRRTLRKEVRKTQNSTPRRTQRKEVRKTQRTSTRRTQRKEVRTTQRTSTRRTQRKEVRRSNTRRKK